MAVSKQQAERPAIIAIIDEIGSQTESLNAMAESIANVQAQLGDGFSANLSITQSLEATNAAIDGIEEELETSQAITNRMKIGHTEELTITANSSLSKTYTYTEPFSEDSKSFVMLGVADDSLQTTLEITLIDSTYSGFSYSVFNSDTDPATVTIGYVAIQVN